MALTLGQRLDDIQVKIDRAENAQSYQHGDKQVNRGTLFRLYEREAELLKKIELHGRDYIEGQNTTSKKAFANVSFT